MPLTQLITLSSCMSYNKETIYFDFSADSLVFLLIVQYLCSLLIRSQLHFKLQETFYRALLSNLFSFYFITLNYLRLVHHKEAASLSLVLQIMLISWSIKHLQKRTVSTYRLPLHDVKPGLRGLELHLHLTSLSWSTSHTLVWSSISQSQFS